MVISNDKIFKQCAYVFFICFFFIGCFVFSDYGISTDEETQRVVIGEANYNFIKSGNGEELLLNAGKYHGPAFELVLYVAEKIFNVTEERSIYLLRHWLTFFTFYIAAICFYFLGLKLFKTHFAALLGVVLLVISPRIFAESFYNCKDLSMLCFCAISAYTMFLFVEKQTIMMALIHAVCCGFAFDIRIMGLLLPIATLYLYLFQNQRKIIPLILYFCYVIISVIAFWPVLWLGPVFHFIEAYKQMSKYLGNWAVLYMGEFVPIQNLPWHYLPVWIGITLPIAYIVMFFAGLFYTFKNTLVNFKSTLPLQVLLFIFAAPILAVIFLHSTVYDGWRHVYFVYPFFVLIAVYGFIQLIKDIKNKLVFKGVLSSLALSIVVVLFFMVKNHPYQNVYFNVLAGKNHRQNFELDYWGLSYKQGLEYILSNDKSDKILIASDNTDFDLTSLLNFKIIPENERNRIEYTYDRNAADYFLTNFRWHPQDYTFGTTIHQIKVDDAEIMEIRKLK